MKKFLITVIIAMLFSGCSNIVEPIETIPPTTTAAAVTTVTEPTTTTPFTTIDEIPISTPEIDNKKFSQKLEAEKGTISGDLNVKKERAGYSGSGYVSGFTKNNNNKWSMKLDIPTSQHYDITISAASDSKRTNSLLINGESVGEINTSGNKVFEKTVIKGIFLEKGQAEFSIKEDGGEFDFDYILVVNNAEIPNIITNVKPVLINKNSNETTKNVMQFLVDNYGNKAITGQYVSSAENSEMELIHNTTGKYPAIMLSDLGRYSLNGGTPAGEIESAIKWGQSGGLVSLMWHWKAPTNEPFFYAQETKFDLSKAVTKIDIATLPLEEIQKLCDSGKISAETVAIIKDIDNISAQLKKLQDAGVTVLWRPLHEASGGWFWWGSKGPDNYKWLWKLMVDRQTKLHGLNNLIWVWNGQGDQWYVGDNYCDIAAADIYTKGQDYSSQVNEFIRLNKLVKGRKMLAVSECGTVPDVGFMKRDNSMWSYFGLWYGEYMMDEFGEYNTEYTSREQLTKVYNSEGSITRDKLPNFTTYKKVQ